MLGLSLFLETF